MSHPTPRRLGIFGGTFDPVHYAHLLLAETCREQCELDEVWLMPAAKPPHKVKHEASPAQHRLEMLQLAVGGHDCVRASTLEIDRGGISYTVDTLEAIHQQLPRTELFLLMGADSLEDLPHWRAPTRICELSVPVGVRRSGLPEPSLQPLRHLVDPQRLAQFGRWQVSMPMMELASSDLRTRVGKGLSIRYRTPRAVEKYIEAHELYTT
ncbi:MAG: nicotinate-nucleotide adenylyltransferase [Planctomycetota bacterium]